MRITSDSNVTIKPKQRYNWNGMTALRGRELCIIQKKTTIVQVISVNWNENDKRFKCKQSSPNRDHKSLEWRDINELSAELYMIQLGRKSEESHSSGNVNNWNSVNLKH